MTTHNESASFPSGGYRANRRIAEKPGIRIETPSGAGVVNQRRNDPAPLTYGCHPGSVFAAFVFLAVCAVVPLTLFVQWLWR